MRKHLRLLLVAAAVVCGCGKSDGPKIVVDDKFEVAPKQFGFHKFEVDYPGTFTLTLTPQGGDVEAWVNPGANEPRFDFLDDGRLPLAKGFPAGKEDSMTGTLDWGGAYVVLYNRGSAPVQVRCKVAHVEKKPN